MTDPLLTFRKLDRQTVRELLARPWYDEQGQPHVVPGPMLVHESKAACAAWEASQEGKTRDEKEAALQAALAEQAAWLAERFLEAVHDLP